MTRRERIERKSRPWHDGIQAELAANPEYRREFTAAAFDALLHGDADAALSMLHDVAKATVGFPELARRTGIHEKSLYRALSPRGNPTVRSLSKVCAALTGA